MPNGRYYVCPHIAVSNGDFPGLEIEARARGVKNLPTHMVYHLAKCLTVDDHLLRPVVRLLTERTIHKVSKDKPRPLSEKDIEEHYASIFRAFGLEKWIGRRPHA